MCDFLGPILPLGHIIFMFGILNIQRIHYACVETYSNQNVLETRKHIWDDCKKNGHSAVKQNKTFS